MPLDGGRRSVRCMGTDPRTALQRLRAAADDGRLDELCRRHRVRVLTAFGSAVRPDTDPRDLDVAVGFEPQHPGDVLALLDDLIVLTGSDELDLLVLNRAGPVVRERALVQCLPLHESQPTAYATAQVAAMGERMDTEWLRALDLEALRRCHRRPSTRRWCTPSCGPCGSCSTTSTRSGPSTPHA
jgi:predicted nucleotidyltransferase